MCAPPEHVECGRVPEVLCDTQYAVKIATFVPETGWDKSLPWTVDEATAVELDHLDSSSAVQGGERV
jgi:hypothetical protein